MVLNGMKGKESVGTYKTADERSGKIFARIFGCSNHAWTRDKDKWSKMVLWFYDDRTTATPTVRFLSDSPRRNVFLIW